jgi:FkbM family methyltransferase
MGGIVRPLLAEPARHLARLARDPAYRAWRDLERRLGGAPRRSTRVVRALGLSLEVPDAASFLGAFHEIFVERILSFREWGAPPRILDLGANIGLSVLYFLREHPEAVLTALEPDPALFPVLERNVRENGGGRATLLNQAAWSKQGTLRFQADGADGGHVVAAVAPDTADAVGAIEIPAADVAALFDAGPYDVVKIDVEGAESVVLPALGDRLRRVRYLFVEYHGASGAPAPLSALIAPMEAAGLTVQVHAVRVPAHPFRDDPSAEPLEQILHLYGIRR